VGHFDSLSAIRLPNDSAETALLKARSFPYEAKTSFQRDFEHADKKDERDLFAGAMLRLAHPNTQNEGSLQSSGKEEAGRNF